MALAPRFVIVLAFACGQAFGQDTAIDFGRDVLPLLRTHCIDCHGPKQQKNGLRLDRRRDAMRGGTVNVIGPGNADGSVLYHRLVGTQFGPQMPPDGPLSAREINVIKAWIDQGAKWPDGLSGETPPAPADARATHLMEALRAGDREAFRKMLRDEPSIAKLKGPGGSTPLMYAALYGDAESVRLLLQCGADANARNDAGATALMWAVDDEEKTRLLLDSGANVNARSDDGRTPLLVATVRAGSGAVVRLLLEHGADPSVKAPSYKGPITPLRQAADYGDSAALRMLLTAGADVKKEGPFPWMSALNVNDAACIDLLIEDIDQDMLGASLLFIAPPFGEAQVLSDARAVKALIERGADVNARDQSGRSVLMLAAALDTVPAETAQLLLERGAHVNAKTPDGRTALDFARQRGKTAIVRMLLEAGAKESVVAAAPLTNPKPAGSARAALERVLPLLQHADVTFLQKSGCVSCHHNSLAAMTVAAARQGGLPVDEAVAGRQLDAIAAYIDVRRERALQGIGIPGDADTVSYILLGMAAENYPPDAATDAMAHYILSRQSPDGRWRLVGHRPPIESSEIELTAASMRALQVYGLEARRAEYEEAIRRAAEWIKQATPKTNEDRVFQLLGLRWAGGDEEAIHAAARQLLADQRPDGGWGQLPTLPSDAYATGQALTALEESGALEPSDAAYQRGVRFLLSTQLEDGSWHVRSRALAFQPYFESGFPHGHDQWISAAATNWAAMALIPAANADVRRRRL